MKNSNLKDKNLQVGGGGGGEEKGRKFLQVIL